MEVVGFWYYRGGEAGFRYGREERRDRFFVGEGLVMKCRVSVDDFVWAVPRMADIQM